MESPTLTPAASTSKRIQFLDVLRGVALFGILVVNLPILGLPLGASEAAPSLGEPGGLTALLIRALAENKFMALFSLLFGMGLALQVDRAEAAGRDPGTFYPRRLVLLAVFGVLNGILLFFGDILFAYSIAGTILYLLRHRSNRTLFTIAAALLAFGTALSVVFEGIVVETVSAEEREFVAEIDTALASGSYLQACGARAIVFAIWLFQSSVIAFNWRILALFLVGCAVLRKGWARAEAAPLQRRLAWVGLPIGLALEALSAFLHGHEFVSLRVVDVLCHQVGGLFLAAGYAGAIALWCHGGAGARVRGWIASTGRMALTNYLAQAFIAGWIFYGHGAGLLGHFSRPELFAITCAIYAAQVLFSVQWLARFPGGPLELFWRRLTYPASSRRS